MDKAKEDWICRVAKEAEAATKDGVHDGRELEVYSKRIWEEEQLKLEVFGRRMAR